jgi:hypothetical protein
MEDQYIKARSEIYELTKKVLQPIEFALRKRISDFIEAHPYVYHELKTCDSFLLNSQTYQLNHPGYEMKVPIKNEKYTSVWNKVETSTLMPFRIYERFLQKNEFPILFDMFDLDGNVIEVDTLQHLRSY